MLKAIILLALAVSAFAGFPYYSQCDSRWKGDRLGTSSATICSAGCLMSSVAMMMAGNNVKINGAETTPKTLNTWLTSNGGYAQGNLFVWGSVAKFGFSYTGRFNAASDVKAKMNQGQICILNVNNGGHWVLATGSDANGFTVNDPGAGKPRFSNSDVVGSGCFKR